MPLPQKIRTTFSSKLQIIMCLFSCNFPRARGVDPLVSPRRWWHVCARSSNYFFRSLCPVCIANFSAELIPAEMPLRAAVCTLWWMCPPTGWMTRGTKTIFLCVPNNWVSLLIINQSSEQLPSADHVTTEQCHAVWRVTRDTGWYLVWPPRSVFIVHRIFTLLHKDTIYQLLAGLGWVVTRYTEHCVLNQVYARCPPSAQPRHTVCIGTRSQTPALPLTQEAVLVVVTRRQWQWPRHRDTHCPHGIWRQNALCPHCAAPLRTSQWRKPSRRVPVCRVMQGLCLHLQLVLAAAECVGAATRPVTHPALGSAGTRPQMLIGAQIWACHLVTLGQVTPPPTHVPTCHQSNYHTFM